MAGRSRPFGGRRRGRGRRGSRLLRWVLLGALLRTLPGRVVRFVHAVRTHPLVFAFVVVFVTIAYQSGSGWVAAAATPALWGAGAVAWFELRRRRTGLTVAAAADALRRERRVRRQWDLACDAAGLKVTPELWPWSVRSEGETVVVRFDASRAGLDRDPILAGLGKIQEVTGGGCREVRMKALGHSGWVELRFHWGDPLSKIVVPNDIPAAPKGTAPYGLSDAGGPVAARIVNDRGEFVMPPTLVVGQSGSGKSSTLWAHLLGFILGEIPVELWVADPAGGVELAALEDARKDGAGTPLFRVVRYADTETDIEKMVADFHAKMQARMVAKKELRLRAHVPTTVEPVQLLIIDELLYCDGLLSKGRKGHLGRVQIAGRKVAFGVIAATQLSKVQDLGPCRDLFLQRIVFRTVSKDATEAALGAGTGFPERAQAHRIAWEAKGVGFAIDTEGKTASSDDAVVKFRAVYLEDHHVAEIARGEVPAGVERFARDAVDPKAFRHAVYRLYDEGMGLVYVGESNLPRRRWQEERRECDWWDEVVEDSDHMIVQWFHAATPQEAERLALVEEAHAIKTEAPRHNDKHNRGNPLRVIRGGRRSAA